ESPFMPWARHRQRGRDAEPPRASGGSGPATASARSGDGLVVADGEAGDEGLEGALDLDALAGGPLLEAGVLDLLGLGDDVVDEVGMAVGEVGADRVEARVGERGDELGRVAER